MNNSAPYQRIAINTIFQFGAKALSVVLSLVSVGLLTRYLGTEKYGWFTLVFTYVSFFTTFADIGYNQTIVREYAREAKRSQIVYATLFNFKLILVAVSVILALVGLLVFPYDSALKFAIVVGVVAVALGNLGSYNTSILQAQLRLDKVALLDIFTKAITVLTIAWFVAAKFDFNFIVGTVLVGNVFGLVAGYLLVRDRIVFSAVFDKSLILKMVTISIPVGITAFLSLLYFKVDTLMLSLMRTPTEVGIYGLSYKVFDNIAMLWGLFMASIFPLLAKYHGNESFSKYQDLLRKTLWSLIGLSVLVIAGGYVFSPFIIGVLGGDKFAESLVPFRILLWSVPFLFLDAIFYNIILSFGKTKHLIMPLITSLVVSVALNLYAIPKYGYIGASYATVITEIITAMTYVWILKSKFKPEMSYWRIF
jgi:O-antigen/teichoic acid export membrane protein